MKNILLWNSIKILTAGKWKISIVEKKQKTIQPFKSTLLIYLQILQTSQFNS